MRIPLEIKSGVNGDDTALAAAGSWAATNNMVFRNGKPESGPGWESLITQLLSGVCRLVFPWTDNSGLLNIAFGTHSHLQLVQGGELVDITPFIRSTTLPANPITATDGSPAMKVHHAAHGLSTGQVVAVSGATNVGRVSPNVTSAVTVVGADNYTITAGTSVQLAKTLGVNPLSVTSGSPLVTVTETAHGISTGTSVTISGAAAVGGITPNGTFAVTATDANHYTFTFTSNASSTATGGGSAVIATVPATGGGSAVLIAPQVPIPEGQINGTGGQGYGTGGFGIGGYGQASTVEYFPRTWSAGAWGENLLASPRGDTIYAWTNDLSQRAAPLANAPAEVTHMLVAPNSGGFQVFALGTNQEADGVFNPMCIRHSSVRNNTEWNTDIGTTAREYILTGGGRIVAGRMCGPYLLVWTNDSLFVGQFVGDLDQPWSFERVGRNCGLAGPNAAVVVGQTAFWVSPDRQFYSYALGAQPLPITSQVRKTFADNLADSQDDKIVASSTAEFGEIRFDYPDARDGSGYENSRYLTLVVNGPDAGAWAQGEDAWTARCDAGPSDFPVGASYDGHTYYLERGASADGAVRDWSITSAFLYLDENYVMDLNGVWPDFTNQQGAVNLEITSCFYPQGPTTSTGKMPIAPGQSRLDFRLSGRLFKVTISGSGTPSYARLGKLEFDAEQGGER